MSEVSAGFFDFSPWSFWRDATPAEWAAQRDWQATVAKRGDVEFTGDVFVSEFAAVYPNRLRIGDHTYIAAHTYVTGDVEFGPHCTLNPFAVARGQIRLGEGVRIGAHASLLGFNHSIEPDRPVREQPVTVQGITIGDDVWIGSNAVVLDGVTVGAHAVIGAGAVVTKDIPQWTIVAGNPARPIRDRRVSKTATAKGSTDLGDRLAGLTARAREQAADVLARCFVDGVFVDRPDAGPTVRAWCDAVEIADLLQDGRLEQATTDELTDRLRSGQDPVTGLIPELGDSRPLSLDDGQAAYHVLCVGYALQLLGSRFEHPVHSIAQLTSGELIKQLEQLPWARRTWGAGAWIDAVGTGLYRNAADFGVGGEAETLFGWLTTRARRSHGMWSEPDDEVRWMQVVNGFYRLTRGTYAQFGVPLPYPERAVDTLLTHSVDPAYFAADRGNACNVLDVIHPLWLCAKQTGHRKPEGEAWAGRQLDRVLRSWVDGAGFSFELETGGTSRGRTPGLQGTEMWLATTWLLADYVGRSDFLGYRPRGVHRPEPAWSLT
ncbi:MAG TPA: acyltransferase [Mycobacteriales bacterium]|nr:acyltransferase [Mycobacteriales bacterium]